MVVSKGVNITISLSAEGEGTTIVSQPPLQPKGISTLIAYGLVQFFLFSIQLMWVLTSATHGHVESNLP